MARFKVYISDYDYPDNEIERSILAPIDAEVIGLKCRTGEGLADMAADADAILQQYAKIPRSTIERLPRCKAICRYGIGVDIVDVAAAYEHGMVVTNVPDYALDEVADHSISLGFMLLRRLPQYAAAARDGHWHWSVAPLPSRFRGQVWGLIGFGRIAQNIAHKLLAFGFRVVAYDPYVSEGVMRTFNVAKVDLDTLLAESDLINVMCPHTPETDRLIDDTAFARMKRGVVLINCARGKVVDNAALGRALDAGTILLAGMDDTEEEPSKLSDWTPSMNPLFARDDCVITPHVAYVTVDSLQECRRVAAENAKAVLLGQTPPDLVRP